MQKTEAEAKLRSDSENEVKSTRRFLFTETFEKACNFAAADWIEIFFEYAVLAEREGPMRKLEI